MPIRRQGNNTDADEDPPATRPMQRGKARSLQALFDTESALDAGNPSDDDPLGKVTTNDEVTRVVGSPHPTSQENSDAGGDPMADPPVGWLVVIAGPGRGHVLTLGQGLNIIGRGEGMRVRIDYGDSKISRSNHARIIYEPRSHQFLLGHGDGTNLTYVDDKLVMAPVELESGARIQLGDTIVLFQALCGSDFDWRAMDD